MAVFSMNWENVKLNMILNSGVTQIKYITWFYISFAQSWQILVDMFREKIYSNKDNDRKLKTILFKLKYLTTDSL